MALRVIVPRDRALEYGTVRLSFAAVPDCEVIIDRRVGERRCDHACNPISERRRGERRSGNLETAGTVVLFVH